MTEAWQYWKLWQSYENLGDNEPLNTLHQQTAQLDITQETFQALFTLAYEQYIQARYAQMAAYEKQLYPGNDTQKPKAIDQDARMLASRMMSEEDSQVMVQYSQLEELYLEGLKKLLDSNQLDPTWLFAQKPVNWLQLFEAKGAKDISLKIKAKLQGIQQYKPSYKMLYDPISGQALDQDVIQPAAPNIALLTQQKVAKLQAAGYKEQLEDIFQERYLVLKHITQLWNTFRRSNATLIPVAPKNASPLEKGISAMMPRTRPFEYPRHGSTSQYPGQDIYAGGGANLLEKLYEAISDFQAISYVYLLNQDPASLARDGFWGSLVEALGESTIAAQIASSQDIIAEVLPMLQEAGLPLTKAQLARGEATLMEKAGAAVGATIPSLIALLVVSLATEGLGSIAAVRAVGATMERVLVRRFGATLGKRIFQMTVTTGKSSLDFWLSGGSAAAGAGEGLITALLGKKFNILQALRDQNVRKAVQAFATRTVLGTGAEVTGEYTGELFKSLGKHGLDLPAVVAQTFGTTTDQATDKFFVTVIVCVLFSGTSQVAALLPQVRQVAEARQKKDPSHVGYQRALAILAKIEQTERDLVDLQQAFPQVDTKVVDEPKSPYAGKLGKDATVEVNVAYLENELAGKKVGMEEFAHLWIELADRIDNSILDNLAVQIQRTDTYQHLSKGTAYAQLAQETKQPDRYLLKEFLAQSIANTTTRKDFKAIFQQILEKILTFLGIDNQKTAEKDLTKLSVDQFVVLVQKEITSQQPITQATSQEIVSFLQGDTDVLTIENSVLAGKEAKGSFTVENYYGLLDRFKPDPIKKQRKALIKKLGGAKRVNEELKLSEEDLVLLGQLGEDRILELATFNQKEVRSAIQEIIKNKISFFLKSVLNLNEEQNIRLTKSPLSSNAKISDIESLNKSSLIHLKAADEALIDKNISLAIEHFDSFKKSTGLFSEQQFMGIETSLSSIHNTTNTQYYRDPKMTVKQDSKVVEVRPQVIGYKNRYLNCGISVGNFEGELKNINKFNDKISDNSDLNEVEKIKDNLLNQNFTYQQELIQRTEGQYDYTVDYVAECVFKIFKYGLGARGENIDMENHVKGSSDTAFRGSTEKVLSQDNGGAAAFADSGGFVFIIDDVRGWDVNSMYVNYLSKENPARGETEISILAHVPASKIVGALFVKKKGVGYSVKSSDVIKNPYYQQKD